MALPSPGFGVYLTIGWPSPRAFLRIASLASSCADFLELGIPSTRPIYDGPVIRETHRRALAAGIRAQDALALVRDVIRKTGKPSIVMAYLGDFEGRVGDLVDETASTGALSLLLPDLPFEYYDLVDEYVDAARRNGVRPAFFASSKFPHRVLARFASYKPLLIYLGLQPATGTKLPVNVLANVSLARSLVGGEYLVAGFSIREPETARSIISAGADAVVVGSEIARRYAAMGLEAVESLVCSIKEALG